MLKIARQLKDTAMESLALACLGCDYREENQWELAINFFQTRLALAKDIGAEKEEQNALYQLGTFHFNLSENLAAVDCFSPALF